MSTVIKDTVIPLYFNSKDRIDITDPTTDYTIQLRKDLRNISSITVSNVGIPRTFTNINSNNNTLLISFSTEEVADLDNIITLEIDRRNYTEEQLQIALQNAFNINQTSLALGLDWTVSYDTETKFFNLVVQYDLGVNITWGVIFIYTPLLDILGIGNGETTNSTYTSTNIDTINIPVNRQSVLLNNLQLNITSQALTNDINTSYITSLAKSFTINADNNVIAFNTVQTLDRYTSRLDLGTGSIGDIYFGQSVDISGDGRTFISGAPSDDGLTGSVYTFVRQTTGIDYFQTPTNLKTQTNQSLSVNGREGTSVAISDDALTMIVGAPGDDWVLLLGRSQGAAHIYTWSGSRWVQRFKITSATPDVPQDQQVGLQVAISGDGQTVAVYSLVETVLYNNMGSLWELSSRFAFVSNPVLNFDGTILTVYVGEIEVWNLINGVWTLSQVIFSEFPVVDMSNDGTVLVTSGLSSVDVYVLDAGTYVLDAGSPLVGPTAQFGISASISGDGNRIAIGDPTVNPGDVWVFTNPGTWSLEQRLTHTVTSVTDPNIGSVVKLSTDGQTIVTSGAFADSNTGSAWVWRYNNVDMLWEEVITSNPIRPVGFSSDTDQGFSSSVSQTGNVFVTGGPLDDSSNGAVWVYRREGFSWNQDGEKITATDLSIDSGARFGHSVSMSGDATTFAVGAIRDFGGGIDAVTDTGAVWVYSYDTELNTWTQQGNKIFGSPFSTDQFQGTSVSLNTTGDILAIGAPGSNSPTTGNGSVFIFAWNGTDWVQQGAGLSHTGLTVGSANGWSVSLNAEGDILVAGAPGDNAVSVFTRVDVVWSEVTELLTGSGGATNASYGQSVVISADGSTIAVAAPGLVFGDQGFVDIWTNINSTWVLQHSISETPFGNSIDLSVDGNVLSVGALDGLDQVDITSRVYVYTRDSNNLWSQFDDPIVGEKRTNTEDYQGFSSSVEYIDESTDFVVIYGGIGFGQFQGGNWSFISSGEYETTETYMVPTRSYTIFDLINTLNTGFTLPVNMDFVYEFDVGTRTVTVSTKNAEGVSNVEFTVSDQNTFDIFIFNESTQSNQLDFSINNNVIKTVTASDNTPIIYDTEPNLVFRKYEAGYTITSSSNIDIQLRDERDRIVDLNGADWVMTAYATIHN